MATLQSPVEGKELQAPLVPQAEAGQPPLVPAGNYYGERRVRRSRMALADHMNVLSDEGGILLPKGLLSQGWAAAKEVASIPVLSRDFVFPGEHLHILVHTKPQDLPPSAHSSSRPSLVVPARDILPGNAGSISDATASPDANAAVRPPGAESSAQLRGDGERNPSRRNSGAPPSEPPSRGRAGPGSDPPRLLKSMSSLRREGALRRSQLQLDSLRRSHFFVQLSDGSETIPSHRRQRSAGSGGSFGAGGVPNISNHLVQLTPSGSAHTSRRPSVDMSQRGGAGGGVAELGWGSEGGVHGCTPIFTEQGNLDPHQAGGLARGALLSHCLPSGELCVLLDVTVAIHTTSDVALLEVLQFERLDAPPAQSPKQAPLSRGNSTANPLTPPEFPAPPSFDRAQLLEPYPPDPKRDLLQWLLPIENSRSPTPPASPPRQMSFNFGAAAARAAAGGAPLPENAGEGPVHAAGNLARGALGSEGLLSFRGAPLEPQRFTPQCGLEGPHVPGKRWQKRVQVLHPLMVESYGTEVNAEQLICVSVENVLPPVGPTADVTMYVDSISLEWRSGAPGSGPLPVHVACVEVGDAQSLPNLPLRPGEQHSFILRPASLFAGPHPPGSDPHLIRSESDSNVKELPGASPLPRGHRRSSSMPGSQKGGPPPEDAGPPPESAFSEGGLEYAVVVACRCSHTESRLLYRHSLTWKPKTSRELLLSVTLEEEGRNPFTAAKQSTAPPLFVPRTVTIRATNLTSAELMLTLLAPSSSPGGQQPGGPRPVRGPGGRLSIGIPEVGLLQLEDRAGKPEQKTYERTASLPPIHRMESIVGHNLKLEVKPLGNSVPVGAAGSGGTADFATGAATERSHLWLQNVVPLGRVPPHATTAVKCDLLPLSDGIITLDTLQACTRKKDKIFVPQSPLQIYTGLAPPVHSAFSKIEVAS